MSAPVSHKVIVQCPDCKILVWSTENIELYAWKRSCYSCMCPACLEPLNEIIMKKTQQELYVPNIPAGARHVMIRRNDGLIIDLENQHKPHFK